MNKQHLIAELMRIHKNRKIPKKVISEIVRSIFDHMALSIQRKKKFAFPGFGSFAIRKRKKRMGHNPKTGESIRIPSRKTVKFQPFQNVKHRINS